MNHPIASKTVEVKGSVLHYLEAGQGSPMVFLHGVPASSYLWRNVLPRVAEHHRCIALDFIGFGKSGKPDIQYTVFDHLDYLTHFMQALQLENVTLVMHGWGSVPGFAYALRHPGVVKRLVFMEAHVRPTLDWSSVSLPLQELALKMNQEDGGYDAVMNQNAMVERLLPYLTFHPFSLEEMEHYRAPFRHPRDRRPLWQFLQELPLGDRAGPVVDLMCEYSEQLQVSAIPKLMFYALPGFNTTMETVAWAFENLPELELIDLGEDLHFFPETHAPQIATHLINWVSGH